MLARIRTLRAPLALTSTLSLFILALILTGVAWIVPHWIRPALEWSHEDRSAGPVTPLVLHEAQWEPAGPSGIRVVAVAKVVRFVPPSIGPFAIRVGLRPEFELVRLSMENSSGRETVIEAETGRFDGDELVLEGRVRAQGPEGRELRTSSLRWRTGGRELRAGGPLAFVEGSGAPVPGPGRITDLWLETRHPFQREGRR